MPNQEPPKYDTQKGTLTDYGRFVGAEDVNAGRAITSKDLSKTRKPVLPPSVPDTTGAALTGAIEASVDDFTRQQEERTASANRARSSSLEALLNLDAPNKDVLTLEAGQKAGLDTLEGEVKDINNQILSEQQSLRRRLEAIDKNPQGMFGGALEQEKRRVENESLAKQADLSVIALAKQGKYDSAKAIADRAVALKFAKQTQEYERAKLAYEENKELFTTAEQRLFETRAADRQRTLDMEMFKEKTAYEQKIKQSDPLYALEVQLKRAQIDRTQRETLLLGQPTAKELKEQEAALKTAEASIPVMQDKLQLIDALKVSEGLPGVVGPYALARFTPFKIDAATKQEFLGGVQKLVGGLTLDNLIEAKARGATFGALSEGELRILANSATAINNWAIKDDDGRVIGYAISEDAFKKELDTIRELTQRAITKSTGEVLSSDENAALDAIFNDRNALNPSTFYN